MPSNGAKQRQQDEVEALYTTHVRFFVFTFLFRVGSIVAAVAVAGAVVAAFAAAVTGGGPSVCLPSTMQ